MSLLINGLDMPKNGRVTIDLASEETGTNIIARITDDKTGKLIEHKGVVVIPTPHGRLIDADSLMEDCQRLENTEYYFDSDEDEISTFLLDANSVEAIIEEAPTVVEAEE